MNKQLYLDYCSNYGLKDTPTRAKAFDAGLQAGLQLSFDITTQLQAKLNAYQNEHIVCYKCGNKVRGSHYADGC